MHFERCDECKVILFRRINFRYDFISRRWAKMESMSTERSDFTMVILRGMIYAIGGNSEHGILNTVEIYDSATNSWTQGSPMIVPRKDATIAVHKNKIYAIGGTQPSLMSTTVTVERFDFDTNIWTLVRHFII